jgi:hypothetical protein
MLELAVTTRLVQDHMFRHRHQVPFPLISKTWSDPFGTLPEMTSFVCIDKPWEFGALWTMG